VSAPAERVEVRVLSRIGDVDEAAWDACAGDDDPFLSHAFLRALEDSGSATLEQGWQPQHLAVHDRHGNVTAVAPLYLKLHSYGEYVFDWSWASAYQRAGGSYYPKLQCCVPFTPVTGRRLLVKPGEPEEALQRVLLSGMLAVGREHDVSSLHITFPTEAEWALCGGVGLLRRVGIQYHWQNRGYRSYDDFLAALLSRKRKALKKERRRAADAGATIRVLRGDDIKPQHWDRFYRFYCSTIDRKWGSPYLTSDFFHAIGEKLGQRVVLVVGEEDGRLVAAALHLLGRRALYGRYWGCEGERAYLHFETCYHRAIELAIELGLERVEAGAQGAHKMLRGYLPARTYSAHHIVDPGLGRAVERFLGEERPAIEREMGAMLQDSPFSADRARDREARLG
jgi:predicted N-acyltransferase